MVANLRSTRARGMGNLKFQTPGNKWQPCVEHMLDECPAESINSCDKIDLMFVLRRGQDGWPLWPSVKNNLALIAEFYDQQGIDGRYGIVSVGAEGDVTVEQSFTDDVVQFRASALAIASDNTYRQSADMNGGLADATNGTAGTWRTAADVASFTFVIGDAAPGGNNDTHSASDEADFEAASATALASAAEITTSCIQFALHLGGGAPSTIALVERTYRECAIAGGGTFRQWGYGGSPTFDFLVAFRAIMETLCESDMQDGYDDTAHLRCCRTAVCDLCIEWQCPRDEVVYGAAEWSGTRYIGEIDGLSFEAYWALRDECHLFVEIDGNLEAMYPQCPQYGEDGTTCRDPEGEIAYTHRGRDGNNCAGTLNFYRRKDKRLRRGTDGHCSDHFCGNSDCTCEKLCVSGVYTPSGIDPGCDFADVIDWNSNDLCEVGTLDPQWKGEVECKGIVATPIEVELFLIKDPYTGECVIYGTAVSATWSFDLEEQGVEPEPDRLSLSWTVIHQDGSQLNLSIACALCDTCDVIVSCCADPIPRTLYADVTPDAVLPDPGADDCACTAGTYALHYAQTGPIQGAFAGWSSGYLPWTCANSEHAYWSILLTCLTGVWTIVITMYDANKVGNGVAFSPITTACDPLELDFGTGLDAFLSDCIPGLVTNTIGLTVSE